MMLKHLAAYSIHKEKKKESVFTQKWVGQQLRRAPPLTGFLLQATLNKAPKLRRCRGRQARRVAETDCAHQGRPVGRLDVAVYDLVRVEGPGIHVLHDDRHVAGGFLEEGVAADDVRRVRPAVDVHLAADLAADDRVGVAVDDLEGVDGGGALVADLVDGAAVAVAEDLELLEYRREEIGEESEKGEGIIGVGVDEDEKEKESDDG
ncbi:hypothetical protein G2W53_027629 [Senna tora]|uniref:Uncharacterized protein n=1 Tax=Senna tora TaxID=362788 RepID=A0A834TJC4_9FABA|nr:hypothetical protein G2W53_027629 [Senna tora]